MRIRMRRLRQRELFRNLVAETRLSVHDLVLPLFVVEGSGIARDIVGFPGQRHFSVDRLIEEVKAIRDLGVDAVLLFGVPEKRDERASPAYDPDGIVQRAVRSLKEAVPDIVVITDVCLCAYTSHGHCGILENGYVANDPSLELLARAALSHAMAGADVVAPSAMLDGQVARIRCVLDEYGHENTAIMSYAAKFASGLYDPFFKHATRSPAANKKTHQMNCANSDEAMREIALDLEEGADIVLVKPALYFLDIVYRARKRFDSPLGVYNVSGEYLMICSAARTGLLNEQEMMMESLTSFKRAGADLIITYYARQAAELLRG